MTRVRGIDGLNAASATGATGELFVRFVLSPEGQPLATAATRGNPPRRLLLAEAT